MTWKLELKHIILTEEFLQKKSQYFYVLSAWFYIRQK